MHMRKCCLKHCLLSYLSTLMNKHLGFNNCLKDIFLERIFCHFRKANRFLHDSIFFLKSWISPTSVEIPSFSDWSKTVRG